MPSVKYREGDWFGVPLTGGGFAVGVIARVGAHRIPYGYFFGPKRDRLPWASDLARLKATDATLAGQFGYLGLRNGGWPIIGQVPGWDPSAWPEHPDKGLMGHGFVEGKLSNLLANPDQRRPEPPPARIGNIRIDSRRAFVDDSVTAEDIKKLAGQQGIDWVQCVKPPSESIFVLLNERFFSVRPEVDLRIYGRLGPYEPDLSFASLMTNVRRFAADSLTSAKGVEAIAKMPRLESLSLGIYELQDFSVLERVPAGLTELSLELTKSKRPSLAPLVRFSSLRRLHLEGQSKDIEVLATLRELEDLTLRSITVPGLDFIADLAKLWSLDIKLGGIRNFSAIEGKQSIKYLEIWQVRDLDNIDIVGRLPGLQNLFLQSLPKIQSFPAMTNAKALRRICVENMKGLHDFGSLEWAPALEMFALVDGKTQTPEELIPVLKNPTVHAMIASFGSLKKNDRFVDLRAEYGKSGRPSDIFGQFEYR